MIKPSGIMVIETVKKAIYILLANLLRALYTEISLYEREILRGILISFFQWIKPMTGIATSLRSSQ
jgi:hypothetical protein